MAIANHKDILSKKRELRTQLLLTKAVSDSPFGEIVGS